jgi:hypothetical protein
VAALALLGDDGGMRVLVANLSDAAREARLEAPGAAGFVDGTPFRLEPYEIKQFDLAY